MAAIIKLSQNERMKLFFMQICGNQSWQVWVSLRRNTIMAEFKMARFRMSRIQDSCHHQVKWEWMSLNQIELVWVRVRVEWECFWVNLREDNKVSESKMAVSESNKDRIQDGCHHQVESQWMNKSYFVQNGWIQDGRIQEGCTHQVNQIEEVWVRVRVEWECSWVNLREDNKVSEYKMAVSKSNMGRIQDGCHHQVESQWMSEVFLCKCWESILASVSELERKY